MYEGRSEGIQMKGIELARAYWYDFGQELLDRDFPDVAGIIAAGLCGSGSECLGYDDEISQDHDFEPGFCLFLPGEDMVDRRTEFRLERAYAKLPGMFLGFSRAAMTPVGGKRHGVIRLEDFLLEKTGTPDGRMHVKDWLTVPEQNLLEVTSGEIWRDGQHPALSAKGFKHTAKRFADILLRKRFTL